MKKVTNRIKTRDVSPFLQWLRDRLFGRKTLHGLRFEFDVSDRTQPDPKLPDGPNHKLFENFYYLRDSRRLVKTPVAIAGPDEYLKLAEGESRDNRIMLPTGVRPGDLYNPTKLPTEPIRDPAKLAKLKEEENKK